MRWSAQFNDLRTQIDQLAKDASYNGVNLLTGDKLSVIFNEKTGTNQNKLDIQGQNIDSDTLGIKTATTDKTETFNINFQSDSALAKAADGLTATLASLRSTASTFGANLGVVQTRQDFSKDLISTLKAGADDLVLADTNAEGANAARPADPPAAVPDRADPVQPGRPGRAAPVLLTPIHARSRPEQAPARAAPRTIALAARPRRFNRGARLCMTEGRGQPCFVLRSPPRTDPTAA